MLIADNMRLCFWCIAYLSGKSDLINLNLGSTQCYSQPPWMGDCSSFLCWLCCNLCNRTTITPHFCATLSTNLIDQHPLRENTVKFIYRVLAVVAYVCVSSAQLLAEESLIGYKTVDAAYQALESDASAAVTHYEGWVIFNQKGDGQYVLWSFTPDEHPAHPAVIRRFIVKKDNELFIQMSALCEANKFDCDSLVEAFEKINETIRNKAK